MPVTGLAPKSTGIRSGWRWFNASRRRWREVLGAIVVDMKTLSFDCRNGKSQLCFRSVGYGKNARFCSYQAYTSTFPLTTDRHGAKPRRAS
jgi:hypothetical protein